MDAAKFVYERCQELRVPTLTLARWAAYGCPVSNVIFDELCKTAHMVATNARSVSMASINHLWTKVNLPLADPRREKLPPRCNRAWFCKTFFGTEDVEVEGNSIWSLVTKMNMYDPFTMMCCVPELRDELFDYETKEVNGVKHKLIGASETNTGIKDAPALCEKLSSLLQLSLKSALQNHEL
uniref:Uncharacterized protein n=1 Tax=Pseudictyota dubia TaxID=2749911 RepID=A0A7R9WJU7_9STRA